MPTASQRPLVIVLMGVSGSGKSTTGAALSRKLGWPFRDADTFHPPANVAKMSRGTPLTDEDRWPWLAAIAQWIDERCQAGERGIVSCSALKRAYRSRIIGPRRGVRLVYLQGDIEVIGQRLRARKGHFMPASLLESQFAVLEEPRADERALTVSIAMSSRRVVDTIIERLRLEAPPGGA
jgi:carbohydrate kinase (thermoresistant glucokinase family)